MRLANKTTAYLKKRYLRLTKLNKTHNNKVLINALNREQPNNHVADFHQEMARRSEKALALIGRELDKRHRKQEAIV